MSVVNENNMANMNLCNEKQKSALKTTKEGHNVSGFALGFICLSPPFSPIRFFLCHFLELRARFWPFFAQKEQGLGAFFAKNVFCL